MINIKKLQQKSGAQKAAYATLISALTAVLLFIVWGYNFVYSGAVSNIAVGVGSVTKGVSEIRFNKSFNDTLNTLTTLLNSTKNKEENPAPNSTAESAWGIESNGVSATYKGIFEDTKQ